MKIAIRMDDITADMDWAKFDRFRSLLDARGVKPLIGIVPAPMDPGLHVNPPREDFWEYVKELEAQGWTLAMHGCRHVYTTKSGGLLPLNHFSEFAGASYEEQAKLICSGRVILDSLGIHPEIFMAPAHSFDRNTLRALRENGFTALTDGFGTKPYIYEGLTFYPISFDRAQVIRQNRKEREQTAEFTTFVVHTNTMTEADFAWYREVLEQEDVISFREVLDIPPERLGAAGHFRHWCMAAAKHAAVSAKSLGRKSGS